jgi:cell division protein FtsW
VNVRLKIYDPILFVLALVASTVGLLFIFDAGYARSLSLSRGWMPPELRTQLLWLPIAVLASFVCSSIRPSSWKSIAKGAWLVNLALLIAVRTHGTVLNGAKRWIGVGKVGIEPSEFAKIAVILYLAAVFADRPMWPKKIPTRKDLVQTIETVWWPKATRLIPAVLVFVAVFLIAFQPDLGTAAVVAVTGFAMFVPGGVSGRSLMILVAIAIGGSWFLVSKESYRMQRITQHSQRWNRDNVDELGYQTAQSELAQADGGVFGVGIGGGRAKHILPATTTDFIMATVGEETGLWGSLLVLGSVGAVVWRVLYLSRKAADRFSMLMLFGIGAWLGIQATVNVMMANAFLPAIGIPLPFISSGGSSLVALWMAMGICQATQMPAQAAKQEGAEVATRNHRWWNRRAHLSRA